ncbi:MAG: hypothetical protein QOE98_834, partial [Gaiellaceae bacterium]|nr:hypothetical protein [Gaiellaceae bacterium]
MIGPVEVRNRITDEAALRAVIGGEP